jgi:hypothetical protein
MAGISGNARFHQGATSLKVATFTGARFHGRLRRILIRYWQSALHLPGGQFRSHMGTPNTTLEPTRTGTRRSLLFSDAEIGKPFVISFSGHLQERVCKRQGSPMDLAGGYDLRFDVRGGKDCLDCGPTP